MNKLFTTGMFRSGTTLLSRVLNSHPNIICAMDPFRSLINSWAHDNENHSLGRMSPLPDYCLQEKDIYAKVLSSNLKVQYQGPTEELKSRVIKESAPYSLLFSESLKEKQLDLENKTYEEIYNILIEQIHHIYKKPDVKIVGTKEVWSTEFSPSFLNTFKNARVINITRDPRAVISSKLNAEKVYPLSFLCRQWRKLAYLDYYLQKAYPDSYLSIRYEDLITSPMETCRKISTFLNVEYNSSMINPAKFVDGSGNDWHQNSSYKTKEGNNFFNQATINTWKKKLTESQVKTVELFCSDLMDKFDYQPEYSKEDINRLEFEMDYWVASERNIADWFKRSNLGYQDDYELQVFTQEKLRHKIINNENFTNTHLSRFFQSISHQSPRA